MNSVGNQCTEVSFARAQCVVMMYGSAVVRAFLLTVHVINSLLTLPLVRTWEMCYAMSRCSTMLLLSTFCHRKVKSAYDTASHTSTPRGAII